MFYIVWALFAAVDEAEALQNQGAGTSGGGEGSGDTKGFSLAPAGASSLYSGHPEYYYTDWGEDGDKSGEV